MGRGLAVAVVWGLTAAVVLGQERSADLSQVPGVVIDHLPAASGQYVGSPALAILPSGDYVAGHDLFGPKSTEHTSARTRVFRSGDRGKTWRPVAEIDGAFWSSLFVHRGALYLLGTRWHYGPIVIRRSIDGGMTWTAPKDAATGLLREGGKYHCAPVPVVEHRGRLWRAMEEIDSPLRWGVGFRSFVMSAAADADLLRADSWTSTNSLGRDPAWLGGKFGGWLEGNVVVGPDGKLVNVLRADTPGYPEKAAVVEVAADGQSVRFDPATGFVDFPGGAKKFTIRHDSKSGRYWSLATVVPERLQKGKPASVRNTLALVSSPDLRTWKVHDVLLHHPDTAKHGFQYVDWLFDGDDLAAVCRTAYDDGLGGAHNAHDANLLTFHRIQNFRRLTRG